MRLNYKTYGKGPALIILHGLFGSLDNWVSHARALSDTYSVYLLDQRNHGRSPHTSEWSYELMAEDLIDFMDEHGIYTTQLLGHSMGGKTAMKFADGYPERIECLVVADMAPKAYPPYHTHILESLMAIDLSALNARQEVDEQLQAQIEEVSVREFLLKGLGRDDGGKLQWKFNLQVIYNNYPRILEPIVLQEPFQAPTLFVSGEQSTYVLKEDHAAIRDSFSRAEFVSIPAAGHWLHAEAPTKFLEIVRNFLSH